MVQVLIVRDARESTKKCTVAPLAGKPDITIRPWRRDRAIELPDVTFLHPDGEPLSPADAGRPLLLVDSSWHHLPQLLRDLRGNLTKRSIPAGFATAYPRKSRVFEDPTTGLASVEALFVALAILGDRRPELLDDYYFKDEFLKQNADRLLAFQAHNQSIY